MSMSWPWIQWLMFHSIFSYISVYFKAVTAHGICHLLGYRHETDEEWTEVSITFKKCIENQHGVWSVSCADVPEGAVHPERVQQTDGATPRASDEEMQTGLSITAWEPAGPGADVYSWQCLTNTAFIIPQFALRNLLYRTKHCLTKFQSSSEMRTYFYIFKTQTWFKSLCSWADFI